jgi:dihydroorotate dehydrogenase
LSLPGYTYLRRLFFLLDEERAHELALAAARAAQSMLRFSGSPAIDPRLALEVAGVKFPGPIGLAAGFDKNAIAPHLWGALGFGFAEMGTVTAHAQPGNPKPRMFRVPEAGALINRLGFNNEGADVVAARLVGVLSVPAPTPLGMNVGCSRKVMGDEVAELEDVAHAVRSLVRFADYIAVNVSSPNTPGLRDLQAPERLSRLVAAAMTAAGEQQAAPPVFVKLAPDLPDDQFAPIAEAALGAGACGLIATNTTIGRPGITGAAGQEVGGLSGAPLRARADECVRLLRQAVGAEVPILGVGGLSSTEDVLQRIAAGADLVSLYSGLIYGGPLLAAELNRGLLQEIECRGFSDFASLRAALHAGRESP